MQIFNFSANFADFVAKKVIFVNGLKIRRDNLGGYGRGLGCTMHIQVVYIKLIDHLLWLSLL